MRYLILAAFLVGCVSNISLPTEVESPKFVATQIAKGVSYPINWTCEQKEVNPSLVWIECVFETTYSGPAYGTKCIEVSYYNDDSSKVVSANNLMCVSPFYAGQKKIKYASFTGDTRKTLANKCGPTLESCVMLAEVIFSDN